MLQFLRSKASSWVIKILFFGLVVSFVVWGIGDIFRGQTKEVTVAEVGGRKISAQEYQTEYKRQLKRMSAALGPQFTGEVAKQMGLPEQVLDQLVAQALFMNLAQQLGMRAPDDLLRHTIETTPMFRNEQGQFDKNRLITYLYQIGMNEDQFFAMLRGNVMRNQLYDSIAGGATAPKALAEAIYDYRNEKRLADTLFIANSSIANLPAPDQAALEKFEKDHAERYQAPEYRKLTVLRLRADAIAAGIKISDKDVADEYSAHKAEYGLPEKRQILTFTVADETAAKKAAAEIAGGTDFAAEAKKATGNDVVDTGLVDKGHVLPEIAGPAFAAAAGALVGPVKTVLGWQLAKVVKIEPGRTRDLAEVKDEIAKKLAQQQAANELVSLANQLDDALAGGASLEEAGRKLALPIVTVADVARDGTDPSGKPLADLLATPQLLPVAFSTEAGQNSPQTDDGSGGYFVVRVEQVTPPALRPLDQVRDKVLADWQAEQRDQAAADKAKKVAERLKGGEDIKAVAQSLGLTVKRSAAFTREGGDPANDVPPTLAALLFSIKPNEVTSAPGGTPGDPGHVVAKLAEIQPANPLADGAGTAAIAQELEKSLQDDIVAEFRKALQDQIPVTTDLKTAESLI
jgi:peptidyl-prolyl cis-trans isomerase D